jgi:hypothetical protein
MLLMHADLAQTRARGGPWTSAGRQTRPNGMAPNLRPEYQAVLCHRLNGDS